MADLGRLHRSILLALVAIVSACSAQLTKVEHCQSTIECRDVFGFGFQCNGENLCEHAPLNQRCTALPEGILERPASEVVLLASIMDKSVPLFVNLERAARLAIVQANREGGVANKEIGLLLCTSEAGLPDGLDSGEAAVSVARHLVDSYAVPAIFGPASSSDVQAVFQAVRGNGTLIISPSATSTALSSWDPSEVSDESPGLLWRTAPPDSFQGRAIAFDMMEPGTGRITPVRKVAAIHETGPYGQGLVSEFTQMFQSGDREVSLLPFSTPGQRDSIVAAAALDREIEEVLFVSSKSDDIVAFLDIAARESGFANKRIFLTEAAATDDVISLAKIARFTRVRGTRPLPLNPSRDLVYATFLAMYQAEFGVDIEGEVFTANSYDAGWMLAYGVTWAVLQESEVTGKTIARGMRRLSRGERIEVGPLSWSRIQQQFAEGKSIDIAGTSGSLDIDPSTEEISTQIDIWKLNGRSIESIYTWSP